MAVNVYGTAAHLKMKRSIFDRNYSHKTSIPFGKLVPIGMPQEVLPGDTWKLKLSEVVRMLTPVAPIMDDISMDLYAFFTPNRVIWSDAKKFFGESDMVAWTLPVNVKIPCIQLSVSDDYVYFDVSGGEHEDSAIWIVTRDEGGFTGLVDSKFKGTLFDYFGIPIVYPNMDLATYIYQSIPDSGTKTILELNALPFRNYQCIYNEFFRNENVTDPLTGLLYDELDDGEDIYNIINGDFSWYKLASVARWKDLFTSCLPAPQRGPAVGLPLLQQAPVKVGTWHAAGGDICIGSDYFSGSPAAGLYGLNTYVTSTSDSDANKVKRGTLHIANAKVGTDDLNSSVKVNYTNLMADLSTVTMATVNQIRLAFATQRYYEKLARGGARYNEYLEVMFGVRPSDAVLQRPQYLGGKHIRININQVVATASGTNGTADENTNLGKTGAYSVTNGSDYLFANSFTEHGLIQVFAVIRKEHTYCQGLDKLWTKRDVFDLYNPTFAHIGEVPVMRNEVYWKGKDDVNVLGYNEAWYEYRSQASRVTGLLNPLNPNALDAYVLTDVFESAPALVDAFIFEDASGLDRALIANASVTDQFIADFYFEYKLSRVMPTRSTPGLIDHY